ncbi:hypothetical protein G6F35_005128 [Rhizopus arrhizus]|nr:hypothetical protein G6F35_005128 [Rhizopus arrhizus]
MAIDVRRRCQRGVGIAPEGIDQHIPRAGDRRTGLGAHCCIVSAPSRHTEGEGASCHAIVLAGRVALCNRGAAAQVNARGTAQHHLAVAAAQLHQRTVAAVDDLAVAVHPQPAAVCIQQSIHLQAVTRGQADASHLLSAGVDGAEHMQAAAIDAERNVARLQRVGHGQVALLELEAAGTEEAARIQLAIQAGEVGKLLRAQQQCAAVIGHRAATGGLATTRATTQGPGQVDAARVLAQRIGGDPPCAVVRCRDVDARTRGGQHVALAGGEFNVAAPAVLVQIVHADATPGQVDAGVAAQHHVAVRPGLQAARGQRHGGVDQDIACLQPQFGAQRVVPPGLAGAADAQITPAAYLQGASRRAGQQRCLDVQCAAAVLPTRAGLVGALGLVDIQRALAGELHLVRGPQRDAVEPEHLAVGRHFRTGACIGRAAEDQRARVELELSMAEPIDHRRARRLRGTVGQHRRYRLCAIPHQRVGIDAGLVTGLAVAMDGRRPQHQLAQAAVAGGRIAGVQVHAAEYIDCVARGQAQCLQCGRAKRGIAPQQLLQGLLVQRQPLRQRTLCGHRLQRCSITEVDGGHRQAQPACAIADIVAQLEPALGTDIDAALGQQPGLPGAAVAAAGAHIDRHPGGRAPRQQVGLAVGHGQHARGRVELHQIAIGGVVAGLSTPDRTDHGALLDHHARATGCCAQDHLRGAQRCTGTNQHAAAFRSPIQRAGQSGVRTQGHTDHQARGLQRRERVGENGRHAARAGALACTQHFQRARATIADHRHRTAEALAASLGRETCHALHAQCVCGAQTCTGAQRQPQRAGVHRLHAARDATARRIVLHERVVAGFVVAGVAAHHIGRGQHQVRPQRRCGRPKPLRLLAADFPRAGSGGGGQRLLRALRPHFYPERARLQRVGRRQQRIGARRQARHPFRHRDALADARVGAAVGQAQRRDAVAV